MSAIQFLYFKQYKETVDIYGIKLRGTTRIRIDSQSITDELFIYIAVNGHSDEFVRLFKRNACDRISLESKEFALSEIIRQEFPQEMIFELLKDGCVDPMVMRSYSGGYGNCLQVSAWNGHNSIVKLLLDDCRIDPSAVDNNGYNCLHLSAKNGYDCIVKLLLQDGRIDPSAVDNNGYNSLHLSAMDGHDSTVKLLLYDGRIDPSVINRNGYNCLHFLAMDGHDIIVKLLLEDGRVDPSVVDNDGNNCLHLSAKHGHDSIVKLLLKDGRTDPSAVNNEGFSCLSIAWKSTIQKMLMEDPRFT
jgi:hypothetical protein